MKFSLIFTVEHTACNFKYFEYFLIQSINNGIFIVSVSTKKSNRIILTEKLRLFMNRP